MQKYPILDSFETPNDTKVLLIFLMLIYQHYQQTSAIDVSEDEHDIVTTFFMNLQTEIKKMEYVKDKDTMSSSEICELEKMQGIEYFTIHYRTFDGTNKKSFYWKDSNLSIVEFLSEGKKNAYGSVWITVFYNKEKYNMYTLEK